jgi:hypothetical protein
MEQGLRPGDEKEVVRNFFLSRGLDPTFDRFQNRYTALIRDVRQRPFEICAVTVDAQLDRMERYVSSDVRPTYTAP